VIAGELIRRPAAVEQDRELVEEVHGQVLDPVAVGPDEVDPAPEESRDGRIPDGEVVVAAVEDPDLVPGSRPR
jgi:hypothetical protein